MNRSVYKKEEMPLRGRATVFISVIIFIIASVLPSTAADLESRIQKFTLKNGIRVLILSRDLSPTVSLYIRHKTGSVDDKDGQTGMAHFLEHMRFKGTTSIGTSDYDSESKILEKIDHILALWEAERIKESPDGQRIIQLERKLEELSQKQKQYVVASEIDRLYTENGAVHMNASTGYDMTTYYVSLPVNKLELWARIESDRLMNPVFREFLSERDVIIEERRQVVESKPERRLTELFLGAAFVAHPYRRPVIGWKSDMPYLSKKNLEDFYRNNYVPANTVITVVGDVSASAVVELIERYFGSIPPKPLPPSRVTEEPPQEGERRVALYADAQPEMIIGYHKPTLPSKVDYIFDIIDVLLSNGRSSQLYKSLVKERQIASSVNTMNGFPGARFSNLFAVFASPKAPHKNEELERALYEELEKFKSTQVSIKELEKAKRRIKADFIRRLSSNQGLANMLSYFETLTGDYRYITKYIEAIEEISSEDIVQAAKKYLTVKNRTVALLEGDGK
ncbi:MAG: insulinase family protein [Syntrophales bacterium]|jgi:predicted Zn-dependent peptidase|nr:insulinase family protein [Syntrophales bacterium]MDY0045578.1 pitrilysin family protein [Syntrophales bacterium]